MSKDWGGFHAAGAAGKERETFFGIVPIGA